MKVINYCNIVLILSFLGLLNCAQQNDSSLLEGPYLGQKKPGTVPELFAPGIVSDGLNNRDVAIMPDGKEIYFGTSVGGTEYVTILYSKEEKGIWTRPEVASFATNPKYMYYEPCISYDGNELFFTSNMPLNDRTSKNDSNIWYVKRNGETWGKPIALGTTVNSNYDEYFPSITQDGTLYFTRGSDSGSYSIYRSAYVNGKYTAAVELPKTVNSGDTRYNAFVARDESYLILSIYGLEDTIGGMDYYIVFRNENDTWGNPVNLGEKINTKGNDEYSPYVSPDGKYFFFMSKRSIADKLKPDKLSYNFIKKVNNIPQNGFSDIYWVDAIILEQLKPDKVE